MKVLLSAAMRAASYPTWRAQNHVLFQWVQTWHWVSSSIWNKQSVWYALNVMIPDIGRTKTHISEIYMCDLMPDSRMHFSIISKKIATDFLTNHAFPALVIGDWQQFRHIWPTRISWIHWNCWRNWILAQILQFWHLIEKILCWESWVRHKWCRVMMM